MGAITLTIPDELAARVRSQQERLPEVRALGPRELNAEKQDGFQGAADVLEFLASLPTPEDTLKLRASERLQSRVSELLEKNRTTGLDAGEEAEWDRYEYLEHLVRMAKASASLRLKSASDAGLKNG